MNNLVVPPMPEPSTKDFAQGRIQSWGSLGWQTAQREAALADELAEALTCEVGRGRCRNCSPDEFPDCDTHCAVLDRYAKHKEARNG